MRTFMLALFLAVPVAFSTADSIAEGAPVENPYLSRFNPLFTFNGIQLDGTADEAHQLEELADLLLIEDAGAYALREGKVPEREGLGHMRDGIKSEYSATLRTLRTANETLNEQAKKLGLPVAELRATYRNHVANVDGAERSDAVYIRNHQKVSSVTALVTRAVRMVEARTLARQFVASRGR